MKLAGPDEVQFFSYTGAELEGPMRVLLGRQLDKLAAVEAQIAALKPSVLESAQKPIDLTRPAAAQGETQEARSLLAAREALKKAVRWTEISIFEAKRTPQGVFYLTREDLELMYEGVDVLGGAA